MIPRVLFVAPPGAEEDAAWRWLASREDFAARRSEAVALARRDGARTGADDPLEAADIVWFHAMEPPPAAEVARGGAARLLERLRAGCGLLLTLRAAELAVPLGLETVPPNDRRDAWWRHEADEWWTESFRRMSAFPHVRGMAGYGPHPLFDRLHLGTHCWAPSEGERYVWSCYARGARPARADVVAVERSYINVNADRIVAWEYRVGAATALCLGAFVHFAAPDRRQRPQLEALVANALRSLGRGAPEPQDAPGTEATPPIHWPAWGVAARRDESLPLPDPVDLEGDLPSREGPLVLSQGAGSDEQFDLAGRRVVVVGGERTGVREVWIHPHRAVALWRAELDGAEPDGAEIVVTPETVVRRLAAPGGLVAETLFVSLEHPVVLVEYRAEPREAGSEGRAPLPAPTVLSLSIGCDLRRMWPYPAGCGGELRFSSSPDGRAALIATASGDAAVALVTSRPAALTVTPGSGAAGAPLVRWACSVALDVPFRLAVVGGSGWRDFSRALGELRRLGVAGLVRERQQREAILRAARLGVRASSEEVGRSFEWAKRRLDSFLADTPGVGRSLLAGYAPSTAGWGDGRPGYAWYFGRDACWTAFALLAIGEFAQVRQVLRFLAEHQDVDGKIMHEVTTSGQHHYDAADSTPLFLLLVARYLAWSGDRGEVERLWPHLQRALAFCALTDTDGDGLIENAGVGHGWIESGPLGGEHVSLYLAACWRAALEGLAYAARVSGRDDAARELGERATRARSAIEAGFFDAARGRYALARMPDGSLRATETALSAVPVLLGAVDLARASAFLDRLAAARFSAPWGVRMLPTDDPAFSPTGYHSGAVWPLFTGWSALAEYRAGRSEAAFGHLMANVRLAFTRQLGAFDEVLHGLEERAAGVCPDQAWSAAMVVQPLVDGLLGVVPDAPRGRLALAPQLPANLVWLEAKRLRCGDTTLDLRVARSAGALDVRLRRASGPSLWVTVAAPVEAVPPAVEVDGSEVVPEMAPWGKRLRAAVAFEVHAEHEVRFPR